MNGISEQRVRASVLWPSAAKCRLYLCAYGLLSLLFALVYGGANYFAAIRGQTLHYYFDWEREIPFVPQMIYAYLSISIVFWLPLFFIDIRKIRRFAWMFALSIVVAGTFFMLVPAKTGFASTPDVRALGEPEGWLFSFLYQLDQPYNTLPSLHIALSTLTILAVKESVASRWLVAMLLVWLMTIMLSVVFVHQHHLADVVSGALLGWACFRIYAAKVF